MAKQRLDFRPATLDIDARPGDDVTWRLTISDEGISVGTVACTVGDQTATVDTSLSATGLLVADVTLTDAQTTAIGATSVSWSFSNTVAGVTTTYYTGNYTGSTTGNSSNGLVANVIATSGHAVLQMLVSTSAATALAAHLADTADAHDASAVSFTPAGTVAATDVQTAIAEVATDAAALVVSEAATRAAADTAIDGRLDILEADPTTAAAVAAVAAGLADHIADTADAHDASSVSFTSTAGVSATDAQAAIVELAVDAVEGATNTQAFLDPLLTARIIKAPVRLSIPTYDGSGTLVHPSVLFFKNKWNGWRYWMAMTPYPGGDSAYENPSILVSNDAVTWSVPAGLTNPIDPPPGAPVYNSDVCLAFDDGYLYCFYRESGGGNDLLHYRRSTDGITWSAETQIWTTVSTAQRLVSPTMLREQDGTWSCWAIDIVPSPNTFVKLTAPAPTGPWTFSATCSGVSVSGKDIWHGEVRYIGSTYFLLISENILDSSGTGILHLFSSSNGSSWVERSAFAGPTTGLYKSSFLLAGSNEIEVWWGSTTSLWYGRVRFMEPYPLETARSLAAAVKPIAPFTTGDLVDRADNGSSAGSASSGGAWTASAGTLQVASNALGGTATANQRGVLAAGHADGRFACRVKTLSGQAWLVFRFVDSNNYWRFGYESPTVVSVQKVVAGSVTTSATAELTGSDGGRLEAQCVGSRILCRYRGDLLFDVTDGTHSSGTSYGFQTNNGTARFDQFFSASV